MKPKHLFLEEIEKLHRSGELDEAKKAYQELLFLEPGNVQAMHLLAILLAEQGNFSNSESLLQKAINIKKDDPALYLHLANIYKAQEKYDAAIMLLKHLRESFPNFAAADNNLGSIYFSLEDYQRAIECFDAAIAKQTNYIDAYYNLGLAYIKSKKNIEALNTFSALLKLSPEHPGAHFQVACLNMQVNKYSEAIQSLLKIIELFPNHFESLVNLGTCYLRLNEFDKAYGYYQQALDLSPDDLQVLFNLGVISMQRGDINNAIQFYTKVVKIDPNHFDAHNNLGIGYLALNEVKEALKHFREAARIDPQNIAIGHTVKILEGDKTISTSPPEYIRALFNSYADHYEVHLNQLLHYEVPKHLFNLIKPFIQHESFSILDLGCGTGILGTWFKPHAKKLVGVDLSEEMLLKAGEKNIYDHLIQKDIFQFLEVNDLSFDLIIAADVLVYFGQLEKIFSGVKNKLRTHGWFLFNLEIGQNKSFELTTAGRFLHSKHYVDTLAKKNHFTIIDYQIRPMRTQNKIVVKGHFYLLRKNDTSRG